MNHYELAAYYIIVYLCTKNIAYASRKEEIQM